MSAVRLDDETIARLAETADEPVVPVAPGPVHLAALLDAARDGIRAYVVLSSAQADAVTLWIAHTHAIDAFETTPFLAVTSPEKRCGKSRLLDVLELLVARPWRAISPTEAVIFRKIDDVEPTLMLDETDAIFNAKNANTEPLRALLNAGNRRGTTVPRCVGPEHRLQDFSIFCAKALAGIGALPDTVADRSIPIRLARKRPDEVTERFRRRDAHAITEPTRQALASWAERTLSSLESARPEIPSALNDRAEEAWEPLLAIADLAGGTWPERGRAAAVQLSAGDEHDDEALGGKLLSDIRDVYAAAGTDRLPSASLATALCELDESPWGDMAKPLNATGLAKRLKPFGVRPRSIRLDDGTTPKGYHFEQFDDAFARYLTDLAATTPQPARLSHKKPVTNRHNANGLAGEKSSKTAWIAACGVVADETTEVATDEESDEVERLAELCRREGI